jgi:hypothetical protein
MADSPEGKLCFVVCPIGDEGSEFRTHADWVLHGIIEPVMSKYSDFTVKRADHDPRPGQIDSQLINDLLHAELVIADLTFQNPNVFYEIGIRHMVQKPIVHMQLEHEKVPFDVSLYRAVKYSRVTYHGLEKAKAELYRAVEAILKDGYQVENPVTNARGNLQLKQDATPEIRLIMNQLDIFRDQINNLSELLINILDPSAVAKLDNLSGLTSIGGLAGLESAFSNLDTTGTTGGLAPYPTGRGMVPPATPSVKKSKPK